jgi:hypothetical protein
MHENVSSWVLSTAIFVWMQSRLLFIGNLIFFVVAIYGIVAVSITTEERWLKILPFALTYSMLKSRKINELCIFFCGME